GGAIRTGTYAAIRRPGFENDWHRARWEHIRPGFGSQADHRSPCRGQEPSRSTLPFPRTARGPGLRVHTGIRILAAGGTLLPERYRGSLDPPRPHDGTVQPALGGPRRVPRLPPLSPRDRGRVR